MIILDLEWNRGYDNKPLEEVLQIGAVRTAGLGQPILDTFNAYIRPVVHKRFGPGAKDLPELSASLESELDFAAALARFLDWCGGEEEFASWGGDDGKVLEQNCRYWGLPVPQFPRFHNLQRAFGSLLGASGQQIALWRAAAYCRVPDTFTFHNALHDAVYTAAVAEWLTPESLAEPPERGPRQLPPLSPPLIPPHPRFRVGPFPTLSEVLNAKRARRPQCPLCGRSFGVAQWSGPLGQQYFTHFLCPDHGRFLCRLTATPLPGGLWRGRMTVPAPTPEQLQEYRCALDRGEFRCHGSTRRKRKRRLPSKGPVPGLTPAGAGV